MYFHIWLKRNDTLEKGISHIYKSVFGGVYKLQEKVGEYLLAQIGKSRK